MSIRREKRSRKYRGTRSVGWGRIGQHRKAGSKGGVGKGGLHKHKWSWTVKYGQDSFGKHGFKRAWAKHKKKEISIEQLNELVADLNKPEIDLVEFGYTKLLGKGFINTPVKVKVAYASKSAVEKIKNAGGDIIILGKG
ncbi:MAG: uL15 family ribosomal protein [Thermoprotei archaeon]